MAAKSRTTKPLRFRGVPASLTGVVPDRDDAEQEVRVSYRPSGSKEARDVMVLGDSDPRIVRLTLPDDVEPGTYEGTVMLGDEERDARLEVEAAPGLRVVPEQLRVQAHPGDLVGADLTLINTGNVPVQVRRTQVFGVFMEGGVERALHLGYVDKQKGDRRRVDVIADNLAQAHPGLVKMKISRGYGKVGAGELRELEVTLDIPSSVKAGRTYRGNWELANLVYPVTITVSAKAEEEPDED